MGPEKNPEESSTMVEGSETLAPEEKKRAGIFDIKGIKTVEDVNGRINEGRAHLRKLGEDVSDAGQERWLEFGKELRAQEFKLWLALHRGVLERKAKDFESVKDIEGMDRSIALLNKKREDLEEISSGASYARMQEFAKKYPDFRELIEAKNSIDSDEARWVQREG